MYEQSTPGLVEPGLDGAGTQETASVSEWPGHQAQWANTMALHTNVGLGDFILMDKITMEEFVKNLKLR